jgi:hypothetical protein
VPIADFVTKLETSGVAAWKSEHLWEGLPIRPTGRASSPEALEAKHDGRHALDENGFTRSVRAVG